jgi:hypothetical protein
MKNTLYYDETKVYGVNEDNKGTIFEQIEERSFSEYIGSLEDATKINNRK